MNPNNLYLKEGENMVPMLPVRAKEEMSKKKRMISIITRTPREFYGEEAIWHYISGEKSAARTHEKKPVFYTKINPSTFQLVNLSYDKEKNIRYAISSRGIFNKTLPLEFKGSPENFFEIIPKEDLLGGEYAFVFSKDFYDFGVGE
jgi:hypothetical protein